MTKPRGMLAIILIGSVGLILAPDGQTSPVQDQFGQDQSTQDQSQPRPINDRPIKDLGIFGTVFPIKERHIIDVLKAKLQSEQGMALLRDFQQKLKNVVTDETYLPRPVEAITPTPEHASYLFNPAVSLAQDVSDHEGTRFYKAGDLVNPLDHITLSKDYLFIDGGRPQQIEWAKGYQKQKKVMIILVKGSPIAVMKDHGLQVFFDQEGAMAQRFKLRHVPCSVSQEGKNLRITEWIEDELTDALKESKS